MSQEWMMVSWIAVDKVVIPTVNEASESLLNTYWLKGSGLTHPGKLWRMLLLHSTSIPKSPLKLDVRVDVCF